jgi:hypothetical protein
MPSYPDVWPGRCTVKGCTRIAGVAMSKNFGAERWARCNEHLGCDDDGNKTTDEAERRPHTDQEQR